MRLRSWLNPPPLAVVQDRATATGHIGKITAFHNRRQPLAAPRPGCPESATGRRTTSSGQSEPRRGGGEVPRGERPLDEGDSPLLRFAADLRTLRDQAGGRTYRQLGTRAHYSATTLSDAAGGRKLPSLAVTLAYVQACDGDPG